MKLTKEKRKKIYLSIYNKLETNKWHVWKNLSFYMNIPYICDMLNLSTDRKFYSYDFEEFSLFKPKNNKELEWWDEKDLDSRKNALLLSAEMCND